MGIVWVNDSRNLRYGIRIEGLRLIASLKDGGSILKFDDGYDLELPTIESAVIEAAINKTHFTSVGGQLIKIHGGRMNNHHEIYLGARIRAARLGAGLSPDELGIMVGVSPDVIIEIERGNMAYHRRDTLIESICNKLHIDQEEDE